MDFSYYRKLLENKKEETLATLSKSVQSIRENELVSGRPMDEMEKSEVNQRIAVNARLLTEKTKLLEAIVLAIQKIDRGEFGKCIDCGQPISEKRLEAVPYEECCTGCQEEAEVKLSLTQTCLNKNSEKE